MRLVPTPDAVEETELDILVAADIAWDQLKADVQEAITAQAKDWQTDEDYVITVALADYFGLHRRPKKRADLRLVKAGHSLTPGGDV